MGKCTTNVQNVQNRNKNVQKVLQNVMVLFLKLFVPREKLCGKIQTLKKLLGTEINLSRYSAFQRRCQYSR